MTRLRLFIAALRDFNLRKPLRHPLALIRARATNGEAHAQYQLGEAYLAGWSVPRQPATGAQWLQRAADQGHARNTA